MEILCQCLNVMTIELSVTNKPLAVALTLLKMSTQFLRSPACKHSQQEKSLRNCTPTQTRIPEFDTKTKFCYKRITDPLSCLMISSLKLLSFHISALPVKAFHELLSYIFLN